MPDNKPIERTNLRLYRVLWLQLYCLPNAAVSFLSLRGAYDLRILRICYILRTVLTML